MFILILLGIVNYLTAANSVNGPKENVGQSAANRKGIITHPPENCEGNCGVTEGKTSRLDARALQARFLL